MGRTTATTAIILTALCLFATALLLASAPASAQLHLQRLFPLAAPVDPYHWLHLPRSPPLHPTLPAHPAPSPRQTGFSCAGLGPGLHSDLAASCQAYHLCGSSGHVMGSFVCPNGTLFNEQFQVCDQFYNVRCGSPYEDL